MLTLENVSFEVQAEKEMCIRDRSCILSTFFMQGNKHAEFYDGGVRQLAS